MSANKPKHSPMTQFSVQDHCLLVGGIPLPRLVARVGKTPFYAYDRALISQRLHRLRAQLPTAIHLHYAVKANPMPALVQHIAGLVDGFDVASAGEMKIALDTGMSSYQISMAGPGKRVNEIHAAVAAGITLHIESEQELKRITQSGNTLGITPRVAVRINPRFELKTSGMKMSGGAKPFGVDEECMPSFLAKVRAQNLDCVGFHIFTGSQNLNSTAIAEAQQHSVDLAIRLADYCPTPVQELNIGGGFGIPYFPGDQVLDIVPIADQLACCLDQLRQALPEAVLIVELGRYLVGESGIYVCTIIDRKISRGKIFLVTDGGLHHHLAASGNFGQVLRKNYPLTIGNRVNQADTERVDVVGPLCTPLDILGDNVELSVSKIGDLLVVYQSGAYGFSSSPNAFLSHPVCQEVLV